MLMKFDTNSKHNNKYKCAGYNLWEYMQRHLVVNLIYKAAKGTLKIMLKHI